MKLHAVYDYHRHQFTDITFTDGTTSDAKMGEALVEEILPNDLVLRDLGYFSIHQLKRIDQKGAYFLSRLPKSTGVYFQEEVDATAVDIVHSLDKHHPHQAVVELSVYLGKERFPVRLIAYRLPEAIVNGRRRNAKAAARKKSRQPSKEYLCWLHFSFYITNVPVAIWVTEVIGTIYRLRWQIELIFKQWKSVLKIDSLKGTSLYRIECLVYGRLCVVCLISMLYGSVCWYAWEFWEREVSQEKLIQWLLRNHRLAQGIRQGDFLFLFAELFSQLPKRLLKQKRKRKTTAQRLRDQETFDQAFSVNEAEGFQQAA